MKNSKIIPGRRKRRATDLAVAPSIFRKLPARAIHIARSTPQALSKKITVQANDNDMNMLDSRPQETQPTWRDQPLQSERGHGGYDIFQRVHYFDIMDRLQGHASVRILQESSGPSGLSFVQSTGHEIGLEEGRALTLLLPLSGLVYSAIGPNDLVARPGQVMVLPRGKRRTVTAQDGAAIFRAIVLVLPDIPDLHFLRNGHVAERWAQPDLLAMARLLQTNCAASPLDGVIAANSLRSAKTLLAGAISAIGAEADAAPRLPASHLGLRRAENILRDRYTEEISISEVADSSGISLRQLQDLFRRNFGLSPHAYLTRLRLEEAHRKLKGSQPALSVTEAALVSGFDHLGRFPQTYRSRFGMLPSRTRAVLP
jgi:AraC-like DNA-binding protein